MHKLTVMVSIYNSSAWLQNRIENLLDTTAYKNNQMQIFLVNATSPDPLDHEIASRYGGRHNCKYETIPWCPVYQAWNYIIENSDSTYLANANTDDIVSPHCYERLMSILDSRDAGYAYPSWYTTSTPNLQWANVPGSKLVSSDGRPGHYNGNLEIGGIGHFPLYRRELHAKYGLYDEQFPALGDADFWARCYHVGKTKFIWHDEPLGCYLWRSGENLWHKQISTQEWNKYHHKVNQYKNGIL